MTHTHTHTHRIIPLKTGFFISIFCTCLASYAAGQQESLKLCCNNYQCIDKPCDYVCSWRDTITGIEYNITARECVDKGCSARCQEADGSWYDPKHCCNAEDFPCDPNDPTVNCQPGLGVPCSVFNGEIWIFLPKCDCTPVHKEQTLLDSK